MENNNYGSVGDRVNVCSRCFGELATYLLPRTEMLKQLGLPTTLSVNPMEQGKIEPCERCNTEKATGYIPCSIPETLIQESRERECERVGK